MKLKPGLGERYPIQPGNVFRFQSTFWSQDNVMGPTCWHLSEDKEAINLHYVKNVKL